MFLLINYFSIDIEHHSNNDQYLKIRENFMVVLQISVVGFVVLLAVLAIRRFFISGSGQADIPEKKRTPGMSPSLQPQAETGSGPAPAPGYQPPEFEYTGLNENIILIGEKDIAGDLRVSLEETLKSLTPPTSAAFKILKLLNNPHVKNDDIAAMVTTDPVFSANILKMVNSAYFNLPRKINSVGTAILFLGYNNFRMMVLKSNLANSLPETLDDAQQKRYNDLWIHSTVVSTCAYHLGQSVFHQYEQELGTIGLLHDIGKYYLALFEKKEGAPDHAPSCVEEDASYGLNHTVLGSFIAREWNLGDLITNTIYYHHYPQFFPPEEIPREYRKLSFIISLANVICRAYGYHGSGEDIFPIREEYFDIFGMDPDISGLFSIKLEKDIERARFAVESFISS